MPLKDFVDYKDVSAIVVAGVLLFMSKQEAKKEKRKEKEDRQKEKEEEKAAKDAEKEKARQQLPAIKDMNLKVLSEMYNVLIEIRCTIGCDRVALFEITDTMDMISCILESVDDNGTRGMMKEFKNMPLATMIKTLEQINDSEYGWIRFDDKSDDTAANQRRQDWGIKSSYNFKVADSVWDKGLIGLHWMHGYVYLNEMEIGEAVILVKKIKNLMSLLVKIKSWDTENE